MRQERFTEQAQEALAASQELVRQYHHSQWDVEHILLALLQQQAGLVGDILKELGVDVEVVKQQVVAALEKSPKVTYEATQIYATPRIARLLEAAAAEADRLKDEFVGTEHLLIAMAGEQKGEGLASFTASVSTRRRCIVPFRTFVVVIGLLTLGLRVSIAPWRNTVET